MTIAILGSGPAGMFAAHAVAGFTDDFEIISNTDRKSFMRGAQYLHAAIPGLTEPWPDGMVEYKKLGCMENYAQRVYGRPEREVSWARYDGIQKTWNLSRAYHKAHDLYAHKIQVRPPLGPEDVDFLNTKYEHVINTVPLKSFCRPNENYGFNSQEVRIVSWSMHYPMRGTDIIIYNGDPLGVLGPTWYRYSQLFGWCSEEYSAADDSISVPLDAIAVNKPLHYSRCPVSPGWWLVGRYGAWQKTALTHDGYFHIKEKMEKL